MLSQSIPSYYTYENVKMKLLKLKNIYLTDYVIPQNVYVKAKCKISQRKYVFSTIL